MSNKTLRLLKMIVATCKGSLGMQAGLLPETKGMCFGQMEMLDDLMREVELEAEVKEGSDA